MGSFPALISRAVNPPALVQVEVPEALARVASVSGPSWQIQGTPSLWFSLNFKWKKSQIIWKWRALNRQPSGKLNWEVAKRVRLGIACIIDCVCVLCAVRCFSGLSEVSCGFSFFLIFLSACDHLQ